MATGKQTRGELERRFTSAARTVCFSKSSIEWFCDEATAGQLAAACELIDHETKVREANKRARLLRQARFPTMKSIDGFDFTDVVMPAGYTVEDLKSLEFVNLAQDFVFFGECGRGKTHLSIALGMLAIARSMSVRYFETAALVLTLKAARSAGTLDKELASIAKADIVILDEFGYIPIDIEGGRLLYQVVSATYEKQSLIVTTNIEFSKWGNVLADDHLATAMCDRLFHHGRLIEFGGTSRRLDCSLMLGKGKA